MNKTWQTSLFSMSVRIAVNKLGLSGMQTMQMAFKSCATDYAFEKYVIVKY